MISPVQIVLLAITAISALSQAAKEPFDNRLYQEIATQNTNKNFIISPVAINVLLGLTCMGTSASTYSELASILNQGKFTTKPAIAKRVKEHLDRTQNITGATVRFASRIYVNKNFKISPQFQAIAKNSFYAGAENVDFDKSTQAALQINRYVERVTDNKIRNIVSAGSLSGNTGVVLVNALYFKAKWAYPFHSTNKKFFHLSKREKVEVVMMSHEKPHGYFAFPKLDAKVLSLDFYGTNIKMLLVLPNEMDGLSQLELKLKNIQPKELTSRLQTEHVRLILPKFKFEFDISLRKTLEKLGIRKIFTTSADFTSLTTTSSPLYVSEVKHKAFIVINEAGLEAAAATAIEMQSKGIFHNPNPIEFKVDHPFYFMIYEKDVVYFAGHVKHLPTNQ